jgi:hypothetical protein
MMKRELAEHINNIMLGYSAELNKSVNMVRKECSEEEIKVYLKPVSHIMALIFDALDNIYKDYPDLKPEAFKKNE